MKKTLVFIVALAGCVPLQSHLGSGSAVICLKPLLTASSFNTTGLVAPGDITTIATLDIVPYVEISAGQYRPISPLTGLPVEVDATSVLKLTQASPSIDLSRPFVLRGMLPNHNYRIYGRAYSPSNALISKDNESYVDVGVGTNDAPIVQPLPISMLPVPFAATTSVYLRTEGRYDYLKSTLYQVSGGAQVALSQTSRREPELIFNNLQGATDYRLVVEAYKLGSVQASSSLNFNPGNNTTPATMSLTVAVPYYITTLAGNGNAPYAGDGGAATNAGLSSPWGVAADPWGNVYLTDSGNQRIRKVDANGTITTVAGNGTTGFSGDGGPATNASLNSPHGLLIGPQGSYYIIENTGARVRKVDANGNITTVAGNGVSGFSGDGGPATNASLNNPQAAALDAQGNLYIAEETNRRVRKVDTNGVISTVAGNGATAFAGDGGPATDASLDNTRAVAVDAQGNLFIVDANHARIRKVDKNGIITTFAGGGAGGDGGPATSASLPFPTGIVIDLQGNIIIAQEGGQRIRKVDRYGIITSIAGNGVATIAGDGGLALNGSMKAPLGITVDALGNFYFADLYNHRIRKLY